MLKIAGVRNYLYQWDLNQKVITDDSTVDEVHFANDGHTENALIVQLKGEQTRYADIPNILLQSGENIIAYEHCNNNGEYTLRKYTLEVVKRQKPDDYVYTETETKTYDSLKSELDKKIDNPISAVVGEVLTVDRVDDDGKPLKWKAAPGGGSASIDKTLTKSGYAADAKIVGDSLSQLEQKVDDKIGQTELSVAVESALTVAKESGQFDGKDGQDGQNGTDGKDGTSVTVSSVTESTVDGGTNIVTFSDGNTLNVRNGSKGDAGKKGSDGKDGTSVSVQSVVESSEDGGANVVTFSDGNSVTVHNGSKGSTGATGAPGAAGADGQPGAAGQDGVTPHIGDNGNWYIGNTDTGVSATGGTYTLPIASSTTLGGVKPIAKTDAMTQGVGVDDAGALWTTAGSGGTDISLGLTSAQVGQIIKVKAVDDAGRPTQWETANDGENWEKVADVTVTETVKVIRVTFDACSVVYVQLQYGGVEDDLGKIEIYPNQSETPYTGEARSAAARITTSQTNKRGYLFVTIDTRKGDKWTAASDQVSRGDDNLGEITPNANMNCEIGINKVRYFSFINSYYFTNSNESVENGVKSITAYGAGMAKGTTMRVWGIKK